MKIYNDKRRKTMFYKPENIIEHREVYCYKTIDDDAYIYIYYTYIGSSLKVSVELRVIEESRSTVTVGGYRLCYSYTYMWTVTFEK